MALAVPAFSADAAAPQKDCHGTTPDLGSWCMRCHSNVYHSGEVHPEVPNCETCHVGTVFYSPQSQ